MGYSDVELVCVKLSQQCLLSTNGSEVTRGICKENRFCDGLDALD